MTQFRTANVGRLRSLVLQDKEPILLLGAGASVTSGIPLAGTTVEKAARWAWCQENGRHVDDYTIRRSDYWPWVTGQAWFRNDVDLAGLYPDAIENLLPVQSDRRQFFEGLINPKGVPPSRGYLALANILQQGWISTVLTTNFDECLQRASVLENKPHRLISIATNDDHVLFSAAPHDPQLIYLHGSVKHYTDKNLTEEVQSLDPRLVNSIVPLFRDHPVIVAGYRGAEASVMNDLFLQQVENANGFVHGVYWCVRGQANQFEPTKLVSKLADTIDRNFQLVETDGFDELMNRDLFGSLTAAGAKPTRRRNSFSVGTVPTDMQVILSESADSLERSLLKARLSQYAERTDLWSPTDRNEAWIEQLSERLDLIKYVDTIARPTVAGWLLFGSAPETNRPEARIEFTARGQRQWLVRCFGEDTDLGDAIRENVYEIHQTITGNLWNQLGALTDLLSLVNLQFRLKAEISKTVSAYNALAIKEMIVNAIVHRDYNIEDPIKVTVTQTDITVDSPGGLVKEVVVQTEAGEFQSTVLERKRVIKGYRNPAISDLFYGGGEMDRRGSGLSDMSLLTKNNNGELEFGPVECNTKFLVRMGSRPEVVDEITQTALPNESETIRFATNLIPISELPARVWHAGTTAKSNRSFYRNAQDLAAPSGHVDGGRFYSFYDLESLADANLTPFDPGDIEELDFAELLEIPNGENIALKLLHDAIFEHLQALGLFVDFARRRAHFARESEPELKITYKGRARTATRTVVKARQKRDSEDVLYYEHRAFTFSVLRFDDDWAIVLAPGYAFTRDGFGKPLSRERTNILSTRRASIDFNQHVLNDVTFWLAVLSEEAEGLFALQCQEDNDLSEFAPTILLTHRLPTVSYNVAAFDDEDPEAERIEKLEELEHELELLANQPDEELSSEDPDLNDEEDLDDD